MGSPAVCFGLCMQVDVLSLVWGLQRELVLAWSCPELVYVPGIQHHPMRVKGATCGNPGDLLVSHSALRPRSPVSFVIHL